MKQLLDEIYLNLQANIDYFLKYFIFFEKKLISLKNSKVEKTHYNKSKKWVINNFIQIKFLL